MRLLILILMMVFSCVDLSAQKATSQKGSSNASKTAVAETKVAGRYEIVVSPYLVIKVDTFTGQTYFYSAQAATGDTFQWIPADIKGLPDESSNLRSKYRLFGQGEEVESRRHFYLLNTETGQTWISREVFKSNLRWEPFSSELLK